MNAILEEIAARILVAVLSKDKEWLWKFYRLFDEIVKEGKANRFVTRTAALLDDALYGTELKIKKEVDAAIEDYTNTQPEVKVEAPSYSEELEGETLLGGEMRLTSPYLSENKDEL